MNGQPEHTPRYWWAATCGVTGVACLLAGGFALVATGHGGGGDPAACRYHAFDAPMDVIAMSPSGDYLVGRPLESDVDRNLLGVWHDGEYSEIDLPVGDFPDVVDVNDSGDMVGWTSYDEASWRIHDGEAQRLKAPDGSAAAVPAAIGADGTVVGTTSDATAPKPVRWRPGSPTASELDIGGHHHGEAVDINTDGVIVGRVGEGTGPTPYEGETASDAWVWDTEGNGRELMSIEHFPSKPGVAVAGNSEAEAITGDWILVSGAYRTRLSDPDKPEPLGVRGVAALDDRGRAYGHKGEALAVFGEKLVKLPGLPDPPEPAEDDPDEAANGLLAVSADGGRIAGRTWDGDDVLWSCDGSTIPKTKRVDDDTDADGSDANPEACEVTALTTLEGKDYTTSSHVSPDGGHVATGIAYLSEDKSDSFGLWHDGEFTTVTGAPESGNVNIHGVNDSGTVLGESSVPSNAAGDKPWRYHDGEFQVLDGPAGADDVRVSAIAADGTVVGDYAESSGGGPLLWEPGKTTPRELDTDGFGEGGASDVSAAGIVVGSRPEKEDYALKAWMWDENGKATQLPDMATEDFYHSGAIAIAGDWVLLYAEDNGESTFYRYNLRDKGEPEEVKLTGANDIDEQGRVYGSNGAALAVFDGSFTDQPGLDDGSGEEPAMADEIDAAAADGSVFAGHSADQPALWTCG